MPANGIGSGTSVEEVIVERFNNLVSIPEDWRELHSLSYLTIVYCKKLKCFPEGLLYSLNCLIKRLGGFREDLDYFPLNFEDIQHHLVSLERLDLIGWAKLKSLSYQLQYLTTLKYLEIRGYDGVGALPEWLGSLSSLQHLWIARCKNMEHLHTLGAMRRLTSLQELIITASDLLVKDCDTRNGAERFKISHIPHIWIDPADFPCVLLSSTMSMVDLPSIQSGAA